MTHNIASVFNISSFFNENELISAYMQKKNEIHNMNISQNDKEILKKHYDNSFYKGKEIINNRLNMMVPKKEPLFFSPLIKLSQLSSVIPTTQTSFSKSQSYFRKLNPDGTTLIVEKSIINNNGKVDNKYNEYKIDKNGNKI